MDYGTFFRTSAVVFTIRIVNVLLMLIITTILARSLGPAGYGQYAFVLALVTVLAIPAQMGLPELVVRETAKAAAEGRIGEVQSLWKWAHLFVLISSLFIATVVVVYFNMIGQRDISRGTLLLSLLLIPLISLGNLRGAVLRGLGHIVLGLVPENLLRPALFTAGLLIFGLWLAEGDMSPFFAFLVQGIAAGMSFVFGVLILLRKAPRLRRTHTTQKYAWKAWAVSAGSLGMISGLMVINGSVDILMLGYLRTDSEVGVYKIAATVSGIITFGLQTMNMMIMPYISRHYTNGDTQALQKIMTYTARIVLVFAVTSGGVVVFAGKPLLVGLFGVEYAVAYSALVILALGQLGNATFGSIGVLLTMSGNEREVLKGVAMASAANILLNLALVPKFGMLGAAAATTISMLAWNIVLFLRAKRILGINSLAF